MTTPSIGPAATPPAGARSRWAWRDRPGLAWLLFAALLSLVHPFVPGSRWLMVHAVMLGAVTHSIVVWSTHFTQALTKVAPEPRPVQTRRLVLLHTGVLVVVVGIVGGAWPVTVAGASLVSAAVLWHAWVLASMIRRALTMRVPVTGRYYLTAAACLPVGAGFGATLATGLPEETHGRVLLAHTMTMLLGWVGFTVLGTLLTLWPTMLPARMDPRAPRDAAWAYWPALAGLAVVVGGAMAGSLPLTAAGLGGWVASLAWWARVVIGPARRQAPRTFAPASVAAGLLWWIVALVTLAVDLLRAPDFRAVADGYGPVAAMLVAGFALQLVLGALSYLVPVVIGGGPRVRAAAQERLESRGAARLVLVNVGLALCLLPVPSTVRVTCSVLVLVGLLESPLALIRAVRAGAAARASAAEADSGAGAGSGAGTTGGGTPSTASSAGSPAVAPLTNGTANAPVETVASGAAIREATNETATGPARDSAPPRPPRREAGPRRPPPFWTAGQLIGAGAALALAVALGIGADPAAAGLTAGGEAGAPAGTESPVVATGRTRRVAVQATRDMRFEPSSITVARGDRLVIELTNTDPTNRHDLVFAAARTGRLDPGQRVELDLGVVGAAEQGWCSVVGHRQMGMVLDVLLADADPSAGAAGATADAAGGHADHGAHAAAPDPGAPDPDPVDPVLPPLPARRVHRHTFTVTEVPLPVARGVWQTRWTFNGASRGPTLHGRVGDRFVITLINRGSMGHSIDFHAGVTPPDRAMRTIPPGQSLTYEFTAGRAGIWMYHCATMPMTAHIAAGMHGAVVIEPPGLPAVDAQFVLVQSEIYLGARRGRENPDPVDADAALGDRPSLFTFNGIADQYGSHPLRIRPGQRVRLWLLNAGPNRSSSFHVVGGQFDTTYLEGRYTLQRESAGPGGAQVLPLLPAQGGFVEFTLPEPGTYPFVTHVMADAERGATGRLVVR